jgi:hypothetical protein
VHAERELNVAGYVVPLNRLWGLLSLSDSLDVLKRIRKPIIAMKPLSQVSLALDLEGAFTFLFKLVPVSILDKRSNSFSSNSDKREGLLLIVAHRCYAHAARALQKEKKGLCGRRRHLLWMRNNTVRSYRIH